MNATAMAADAQPRVKSLLQNSIRLGRCAHVYLFHGLPGTGKKQTALWFAQALLCREGGVEPCGACAECRKMGHGNHPDCHIIEPDGASIKIEQIRSLQRMFAYKASDGQKKIYIIEHADKMTIQAANSLLKFLEEPAADITALLLTDNGQAILPTIQSRSQMVAFLPQPPDRMAELLIAEGLSPVLVRPAVHLASGLAAARQLCQLDEFAEIRKVVIQLAKECLSSPSQALLTIHQKLAKSPLMDHLHLFFQLWALVGKDMLHIQCNRKERIVYIDQEEWLTSKAYSHQAEFWVSWMERALEQEKRSKYHVNAQLLLEQLAVYSQGV